MKKFMLALAFVGLFVSQKIWADGPLTFNMYASTTLAVVNGPGSLFTIAIASGTVGDYIVCYDTYTNINTSLATFIGTSAIPELLRVFVTSSNATPGIPAVGYAPANVPPIIDFNNGLSCAQSAAVRGFVWYRQPN